MIICDPFGTAYWPQSTSWIKAGHGLLGAPRPESGVKRAQSSQGATKFAVGGASRRALRGIPGMNPGPEASPRPGRPISRTSSGWMLGVRRRINCVLPTWISTAYRPHEARPISRGVSRPIRRKGTAYKAHESPDYRVTLIGCSGANCLTSSIIYNLLNVHGLWTTSVSGPEHDPDGGGGATRKWHSGMRAQTRPSGSIPPNDAGEGTRPVPGRSDMSCGRSGWRRLSRQTRAAVGTI